MDPLATSFLSAILLWVVAMSDIRGHARKGSFTTAQLAATAVAVSLGAIGAIAALNAAVPFGRDDIAPNTGEPPAKQGCEGLSHRFVYNFGPSDLDRCSWLAAGNVPPPG